VTSLLYAPGVRIHISTQAHGILDVSDDVTSGSLELRQDEPHSLQFRLLNQRRKYDRIFTPNDRVTVQLKRIRWVQVFSGYLDQVPYFSAYPRAVSLSATCTLKRLQFTYWDQGAPDTVGFLQDFMRYTGDDAFASRAYAVLTHPEIGRWEPSRVHIGRMPPNWAGQITEIMQEDLAEAQVPNTLLGSMPIISGGTIASTGTLRRPRADGTYFEPGNGYGILPVTIGSARIDDTIDANEDPDGWYLRMRWSYYHVGDDGGPEPWLQAQELADAKEWWSTTRLILLNPDNNKAVVVQAGKWGPNLTTGKQMETSSKVLAAIGATESDALEVRFAGLGSKLGPVEMSVVPTTLNPTTTVGINNVPASVSVNASDADEVSFKAAEKLQPNTYAARQFTAKVFGNKYGIGGQRYTYINGTNKKSDHWFGLALDIMVSGGGEPNAEQIARGNSIAMWFASNPLVFGVKYVIWMGRVISGNGKGWHQYKNGLSNPSPSDGHRNHVHVSFNDTKQTSAGPFGSPLPGATNGFTGGFASGLDPSAALTIGGSGSSIPSSVYGGGPLSVSLDWAFAIDTESGILAGPRALMNDEPLMPFIKTMFNNSMRAIASAPNGDFIAWFPDYFGLYGLAGKMIIRPIELQDFTVAWSDQYMKTHVFTAGAYALGAGSPYSAAAMADRRAYTMGIASIEMKRVMKALLNIPDTGSAWSDSKDILDRFGARPHFEPMYGLADAKAEFWYALYLFQKYWAEQFSAQMPVTFMPELFPGMLAVLEGYGVQFYVRSVRHSWNLDTGGGFETSVEVIAPSASDGSGFLGLPKGKVEITTDPIENEE
jgi:hypothetical protein